MRILFSLMSFESMHIIHIVVGIEHMNTYVPIKSWSTYFSMCTTKFVSPHVRNIDCVWFKNGVFLSIFRYVLLALQDSPHARLWVQNHAKTVEYCRGFARRKFDWEVMMYKSLILLEFCLIGSDQFRFNLYRVSTGVETLSIMILFFFILNAQKQIFTWGIYPCEAHLSLKLILVLDCIE